MLSLMAVWWVKTPGSNSDIITVDGDRALFCALAAQSESVAAGGSESAD